jgi:hypothetical protein
MNIAHGLLFGGLVVGSHKRPWIYMAAAPSLSRSSPNMASLQQSVESSSNSVGENKNEHGPRLCVGFWPLYPHQALIEAFPRQVGTMTECGKRLEFRG